MSDVWVCEWTPYQMLLQGDYLWHNLTSLSQLGSSIKHFYQYVQVGFTRTISLRFLRLRCVFPLTMLIYAYFLKFCRFYYSMNSLQIIIKLSQYKSNYLGTRGQWSEQKLKSNEHDQWQQFTYQSWWLWSHLVPQDCCRGNCQTVVWFYNQNYNHYCALHRT